MARRRQARQLAGVTRMPAPPGTSSTLEPSLSCAVNVASTAASADADGGRTVPSSARRPGLMAKRSSGVTGSPDSGRHTTLGSASGTVRRCRTATPHMTPTKEKRSRAAGVAMSRDGFSTKRSALSPSTPPCRAGDGTSTGSSASAPSAGFGTAAVVVAPGVAPGAGEPRSSSPLESGAATAPAPAPPAALAISASACAVAAAAGACVTAASPKRSHCSSSASCSNTAR
mmetsp:Transcript_16786/g.58707  ORF Transcript_16786/g.58707 Transcript_16786/m.58707 type:complete len:229 (-) Transcript_16786:187-873(-)